MPKIPMNIIAQRAIQEGLGGALTVTVTIPISVVGFSSIPLTIAGTVFAGARPVTVSRVVIRTSLTGITIRRLLPQVVFVRRERWVWHRAGILKMERSPKSC